MDDSKLYNLPTGKYTHTHPICGVDVHISAVSTGINGKAPYRITIDPKSGLKAAEAKITGWDATEVIDRAKKLTEGIFVAMTNEKNPYELMGDINTVFTGKEEVALNFKRKDGALDNGKFMCDANAVFDRVNNEVIEQGIKQWTHDHEPRKSLKYKWRAKAASVGFSRLTDGNGIGNSYVEAPDGNELGNGYHDVESNGNRLGAHGELSNANGVKRKDKDPQHSL